MTRPIHEIFGEFCDTQSKHFTWNICLHFTTEHVHWYFVKTIRQIRIYHIFWITFEVELNFKIQIKDFNWVGWNLKDGQTKRVHAEVPK